MKRHGVGRVLIATGLISVSALVGGQAMATDIESLRTEAQSLGSQVSDLERSLIGLRDRRARLEERLAGTTSRIGLLELEKHEIEGEYRNTMSLFVRRAVEAYKAGPTGNVALLLSAENMSELLTLGQAQVRAADRDAQALAELATARNAAQRKQDEIDKQQQSFVSTYALVRDVTESTEQAVQERRALLAQVVEQIEEIEEKARLAAAASADPDASLLELLAPAGPAPDIPDGFAGTGVTFEGIASWYGPGFEGNTTASGDVFDPDLYTAASRDLPFGTWLFVRYGSRGVVVLINDRGPYIEDRVLDLSQAAAEAIGLSGIGWIEAEILIKT